MTVQAPEPVQALELVRAAELVWAAELPGAPPGWRTGGLHRGEWRARPALALP